jgi:hypothetical protein
VYAQKKQSQQNIGNNFMGRRGTNSSHASRVTPSGPPSTHAGVLAEKQKDKEIGVSGQHVAVKSLFVQKKQSLHKIDVQSIYALQNSPENIQTTESPHQQ